MYVTTHTNIWAWLRAIALELYGCCLANIEHRTLLILAAVSCLWLTYSTFIQWAIQESKDTPPWKTVN